MRGAWSEQRCRWDCQKNADCVQRLLPGNIQSRKRKTQRRLMRFIRQQADTSCRLALVCAITNRRAILEIMSLSLAVASQRGQTLFNCKLAKPPPQSLPLSKSPLVAMACRPCPSDRGSCRKRLGRQSHLHQAAKPYREHHCPCLSLFLCPCPFLCLYL